MFCVPLEQEEMMYKRVGGMLLWLVITSVGVGSGADELVVNPQFQTESGQTLPKSWSLWKPQWDQAACSVRGVAGGCSWSRAAIRMRLAV